MCWEFIEAATKQFRPGSWTPCFLEGLDVKCGEVAEAKADEVDMSHDGGELPGLIIDYFKEKSFVGAEEIGAEIPLPVLPAFWTIPSSKEWEINHEGVQQQLELIPNYSGWRKAQWRKNKKYLDVNEGTLLHMNLSSTGTLNKRPTPPKDWAHQFLVVPDFLDYGKIEYGSVAMKVLFLQNYHGTNPGRFRFENMGPCVKYLCELGMVPPGLSRAVRVFFRASALGFFTHEIQIVTQYDIFDLPIFAEVVQQK